jgi:IK cytokine
MTPRHPGDGSRHHRTSSEGDSSSTSMAPPGATPSGNAVPSSVRKHYDKEKSERRKSKKSLYAKIKKEEDEQMAELAKRYRDRAKERREGVAPEASGGGGGGGGSSGGTTSTNSRESELLTSQGAYRAVAPDFRGNMDAAERRKQLIQESKFLGGDMEHTHLVKGLDYALLQKVKSEIDTNPEDELMGMEVEDESTAEKDNNNGSSKEMNKSSGSVGSKESVAAGVAAALKKEKATSAAAAVADLESQFTTKLGRNVFRVLFRSAVPERNELFVPGRMAYVMDLEEEYAESDIPTTLIRSKADVPLAEGQATLTTNDIVINKLAQILSYLRQGAKTKKKKANKEAASASGSGSGNKAGDREKVLCNKDRISV